MPISWRVHLPVLMLGLALLLAGAGLGFAAASGSFAATTQRARAIAAQAQTRADALSNAVRAGVLAKASTAARPLPAGEHVEGAPGQGQSQDPQRPAKPPAAKALTAGAPAARPPPTAGTTVTPVTANAPVPVASAPGPNPPNAATSVPASPTPSGDQSAVVGIASSAAPSAARTAGTSQASPGAAEVVVAVRRVEVTPEMVEAARKGNRLESAKASVMGVQGLDAASVQLANGTRVAIGDVFRNGERLLAVDPRDRFVVTDRRTLLLD